MSIANEFHRAIISSNLCVADMKGDVITPTNLKILQLTAQNKVPETPAVIFYIFFKVVSDKTVRTICGQGKTTLEKAVKEYGKVAAFSVLDNPQAPEMKFLRVVVAPLKNARFDRLYSQTEHVFTNMTKGNFGQPKGIKKMAVWVVSLGSRIRWPAMASN